MEEDRNANYKTHALVVLANRSEVGFYRIVDKSRIGGLREIYLAENAKLKCMVAPKFLPSHLSQDADCRQTNCNLDVHMPC